MNVYEDQRRVPSFLILTRKCAIIALMKVLVFDKQAKTAADGMATYSKIIINNLIKKGHQVTVLRFGDKLGPADPPNTILLPYSLGDKAFYFLPTLQTEKIVRQTFAEFKPDIAHINFSVSLLDFSLPQIAHDYKVPVIGTMHQGFSESNQLSLGNVGVKSYFLSHLACLKQLDKLLVFSSTVKNFFVSNGLLSKKIEVMPNCVDCQKYAPGKSQFKQKNHIDFAYLFLGRISRQKNPDILLETFANIKPPSNQKLIVVGSGDYGIMYQNLRRKYQHHPQIIFTGVISDLNQKIDVIRAADVFVLPSSWEGMAFALLEAMACGLAPIVTDAGSHKEVVGKTGIVIENNLIKEQLPIAMQLFAKFPEIAKPLGNQARQKVVREFDQEIFIKKLISLYQEAV